MPKFDKLYDYGSGVRGQSDGGGVGDDVSLLVRYLDQTVQVEHIPWLEVEFLQSWTGHFPGLQVAEMLPLQFGLRYLPSPKSLELEYDVWPNPPQTTAAGTLRLPLRPSLKINWPTSEIVPLLPDLK